MTIQTTVKYDLKFQVHYFHAQEGGMDSAGFGKEVGTIEEALFQLSLAKASHPDDQWIITCDPTVKIS